MSVRKGPVARFRRGLRFLLAASLLIVVAACHWGQAPKPAFIPPPEPVAAQPKAAEPVVPPLVPQEGERKGIPVESTVSASEAGPGPSGSAPLTSEAPQPKAPEAKTSEAPQAAVPGTPASGPAAAPSAHAEKAAKAAPSPAASSPGHAASVPGPVNGKKAVPSAAYGEPGWAQGNEELVYRVEFLGMTMGYARFTYKGKAVVDGRETYHLNVRAWTSDFLAVIYPVNETIDYYMDARTLEPLRVDYSAKAKEKADTAFYDQKKGRIVYRYKDTGAIRKEVDLVPSIFDPVTAAYYFRARDLGHEERPRNVYGGRKLYQISSRLLGKEKIDTVRGPVETVIVQPIIKREGQVDNKGDLKVWMTEDARHIPVRFYAKFKKIKMWTLYAELVPPKEGG